MDSLNVLKFSREDCGTCHRIINYDARVAEELCLAFASVMLQVTETYRRYRKVLCCSPTIPIRRVIQHHHLVALLQ